MAATLVTSVIVSIQGVTAPIRNVAESPRPTTLRFATYNVCAAHCPDLLSFTRRAPKLTNTITASSADIVGVEELGGSKTRATFVKNMALEGYAYTHSADGCAVFYKKSTVAITDVSGSRMSGAGFSMRASSQSNWRGGAFQMFRSLTTDQLFLVEDTDLSALDSHTKDLWRLTEFKKATALLVCAKKKYPTAHTVLVGDFNSLTHKKTGAASDSERWRVNALLVSRGFRDAMHATTNHANYTLASINQLPNDHRRFPRSFQLDHFYVERGVTVNHWVLANRKVPYKNQYSDHAMIYMMATFPVN